MRIINKINLLAVVFLMLIATACYAQKEAVSKSSNAIPYLLDEWKGSQGKTLADSKPYFVGPRAATEGSPNVLVIMLDDAGYSNAGSYGGAMKTSAFDRIAAEGIKYTHMTVAAVCSPTRGAY